MVRQQVNGLWVVLEVCLVLNIMFCRLIMEISVVVLISISQLLVKLGIVRWIICGIWMWKNIWWWFMLQVQLVLFCFLGIVMKVLWKVFERQVLKMKLRVLMLDMKGFRLMQLLQLSCGVIQFSRFWLLQKISRISIRLGMLCIIVVYRLLYQVSQCIGDRWKVVFSRLRMMVRSMESRVSWRVSQVLLMMVVLQLVIIKMVFLCS